MRIHSKDRTQISFAKLSDADVLKKSPLATNDLKRKYFNDSNFQYIVNHIAEIFGLQHDSIHASVINNDYETYWNDLNRNSRVESDEIVVEFTMNAAINTYSRATYYGKNFMYYTAATYGYEAIFGIAAHEIGHLINQLSMTTLETQILNGETVLMQTTELHPHWNELCADYLAGIVLAKASPRLNHQPMIESLRYSESDADHPDGFWRVYAIDMGHQWGRNNSPMLTDRILSDTRQVRQLLESFCQVYYKQIYCCVSPLQRHRYSPLSSTFSVPCSIPLGTI